jgi:hypothetical protein
MRTRALGAKRHYGNRYDAPSWGSLLLKVTDTRSQEGWLAENAVSEEDKLARENAKAAGEDRPEDPMQGLEGLDVAGPKRE